MRLLKQWTVHRFVKSGIGHPLSTRLASRGASSLAVVVATTAPAASATLSWFALL